MDGMRFDRLVRRFATPGTRRGLLSGLGAVSLLGLFGGQITPEGEAAGRQRRKAKHSAGHHQLQQEGKRKKCAKAGQKSKRGKRCCPGLVDDGAGRCRASQDVPTPPDDAGGSDLPVLRRSHPDLRGRGVCRLYGGRAVCGGRTGRQVLPWEVPGVL